MSLNSFKSVLSFLTSDLPEQGSSALDLDLACENASLRAGLEASERRVRVGESEQKISDLRIQTHEAKIIELEKTLQNREDYITWLLKQVHGPTSEGRSWDSLTPELQLWLEGMGLELPDFPLPPDDDETEDDPEKKPSKKRTDVKKTGRISHNSDATILDFDMPNPEAEGIPADQLELVETRTIQKIVRVKSPYCIVRVHFKTYRSKDCWESAVPMELPEVLPGSIYDVSFLAGLAVDKYQFHLPIYRQHQAIENAGIFLDRGNLVRALHKTGELLEPIYGALISSVLASSILTADETPTPVGHKKGKMGKGWFWGFFGDQNEVYYLFSPSRGGQVLKDNLARFRGTLVCDGYAAYESFVKATEGCFLVQCWSHTRRKFLRAENRDPERVKWIIRQIKLMYKVEEKVRGKPPDEILKARQNEIKPLVDGLFDFLKITIAEETFVPSDPFLEAANYALNREGPLKAFLDNPEIPMDTNHMEREFRPHAVGRKNWMFHVTEGGAHYAAIFYSLIRSCILCDVNPYTYLVDVLQRITGPSPSNAELLIPRLWKEHFGEAPLQSPFHEALLPSSASSTQS